jgi:hypothetical protein
MATQAMAARSGRKKVVMHDGFLRHAGFRWLKISSAIMLICIVSYMFIDVSPRHNGGSWYGYTLGTIGALLILWLTMLGVRKRAMTPGQWSLKAWTSAHVYLGLSLIVIGTLHTGFQLGWNIHTAAYVFMMIVIISGIVGIYFYVTIPKALSDNRDEMTETEMLENLRSLDRQLHEAAQPLSGEHATLVLQSLEQDPFGGGFFRRTCAASAPISRKWAAMIRSTRSTRCWRKRKPRWPVSAAISSSRPCCRSGCSSMSR